MCESEALFYQHENLNCLGNETRSPQGNRVAVRSRVRVQSWESWVRSDGKGEGRCECERTRPEASVDERSESETKGMPSEAARRGKVAQGSESGLEEGGGARNAEEGTADSYRSQMDVTVAKPYRNRTVGKDRIAFTIRNT
ncbi:hypothetical protein EDB84DRAFT_1435362 [Lactarius hengduanensis]|nr:hypothetical protein EDB84DRAFT_1435362 [Lactarius hengduanensis]